MNVNFLLKVDAISELIVQYAPGGPANKIRLKNNQISLERLNHCICLSLTHGADCLYRQKKHQLIPEGLSYKSKASLLH
jgi:ABC-type microcin C transport system permease subunit YejB